MGFGTFVCTYIYGSFLIVKTALEAYTTLAKNVLKRIDALLTVVTSTIELTIDAAITIIINTVQMVMKQLGSLLTGGMGGSPDSIWCNRLFSCLALLNQLLDPNSVLFRFLSRWFKEQCSDDFAGKDLLNEIRNFISDFDTFSKTICKWGFTFEFGIAMIRSILNQFKEQLMGYVKWFDNQIRKFKKMLEGYLNFCISSGIIDYLEKLESFFACVLDESELCSSIATSSNFYKETCSKLGIEKQGDGWDISTANKNKIYGGLDGYKIQCSNLSKDIDSMINAVVNPSEVERANKAFNLAKNVFPAGITLDDIKENGLFSKKTWRKNAMYQYYNQTKDAMSAAWDKAWGHEPENGDYAKLADGTEIDSEGNIYSRRGCDLIKIEPPKLEKPIYSEMYISVDAEHLMSDEVLLDPDTEEFIPVTMAAYRIASDPDSKLATRCSYISKVVNGWEINAPIAVKGNEVNI